MQILKRSALSARDIAELKAADEAERRASILTIPQTLYKSWPTRSGTFGNAIL